jgi:Transcriptional regulator
MHLLIVLAETRSFAKAAERLAISRSSASMRIAALEKAAGVPLVRRSTRQVSLTEAGQQLVADITPAFERIQSSFHSVHDLTGSPRGALRVTAPVALGRQCISPSLGAFLLKYPDIRVELELTDRLVNLSHEGFDLAVRHARHIPDDYVVWQLAHSESFLVASDDYIQKRGMPDNPSDLVDHDFALYIGSSRSLAFQRRDGNAAPEYVDVNTRFTANNSEVLREIVLSGAAIGLLPDFSMAATVPALRRVMTNWTVQGYFGSHIVAVRPFSPSVPLAVHCLVDHLRQLFSGQAVAA